jgi:AcrR family transcriptional regulator
MPPRKPLTRKRVLDAAIRMADRRGIEAVTMRTLARSLGVEAMSLYNHVANKDDLIAGMLDAVVAEIELPSDEEDWKAALQAIASSYRDVLVRHPWASRAGSAHSGGSAQFAYGDALLRTFRRAGFSDDAIYHAFHIFEAYVVGFASLHLSVPYSGEQLAGLASRFLETFPVDDYPDLAEHIRQHLEPAHGEKGGFELGLDLILDGLEQLRA